MRPMTITEQLREIRADGPVVRWGTDSFTCATNLDADEAADIIRRKVHELIISHGGENGKPAADGRG